MLLRSGETSRDALPGRLGTTSNAPSCGKPRRVRRLVDAARVREDKAREGWHCGLGKGREKGKCVAKGHLEREGAGLH